jgi:next-to-BRCA1 protein 1
MYTMGDRSQTCVANDRPAQTSSKSTETTPSAPSVNAATQVQTVAEVKPSEPVKEEPKVEKAASAQLEASFVRDTITDGTKMEAGHQFQQIWTLTNPGPNVWPAGCSVRFVGGDNNMLNVDPDHPSSVDDIEKAIESNTIARVVEVGEEVDFVVTIKAPRRCGKAISYWRLKSADGTPFGHRLWCDIDVIEKEVKAEPTPEPVVKKEPKCEEIKEEEHTSQMIFPKLDKESPVSSTHEGLSSGQSAALPSSIPAEEQLLIIDEVEPLELDVYETSDDGFMTDEEYEILDMDSHDEEAINGKK